jgi:hypothetical protein
LRRNAIGLHGFFSTGSDLHRNALLVNVFFTNRVLSFDRNGLTSMLVALAKVALRNRHLAVRTIAELDAGVAAGKVAANQLFPMFDILGNDKVGSLGFYGKKRRVRSMVLDA